jgi:hypothetical protein
LNAVAAAGSGPANETPAQFSSNPQSNPCCDFFGAHSVGLTMDTLCPPASNLGDALPMTSHETTIALDARPINLRSFDELNYWAQQFGVTRERIIRAVHTVGPIARDVEREVRESD